MTVKNVTAAALAVVLAAAAFPVFADVLVENGNSAVVTNVVTSGANSGGNWAGGSEGGKGGRGGRIANDGGSQNVNSAETGNGGNGGDAGVGGTITTGDALANANLDNTVNDNDTNIDLCGCNPEHPTSEQTGHNVTVRNGNSADVLNAVTAGADTGNNDADGSRGGRGGKGGDIYNGGEGQPEGPATVGGSQNVNSSKTGKGGTGGAGADGGLVTTGHSESNAMATSVTNRNVTRIKH